jgi:hypothetical protein
MYREPIKKLLDLSIAGKYNFDEKLKSLEVTLGHYYFKHLKKYTILITPFLHQN